MLSVSRKGLAELTSRGLRLEQAAIIAPAPDGLRLLEILSLSPLKDRQRNQGIRELLNLAGKEIQQ